MAGRFGWTEVRLAVVLLPGIVAGFALSRWTADRLDKRQTHLVVLATSALAGALVLVKRIL